MTPIYSKSSSNSSCHFFIIKESLYSQHRSGQQSRQEGSDGEEPRIRHDEAEAGAEEGRRGVTEIIEIVKMVFSVPHFV